MQLGRYEHVLKQMWASTNCCCYQQFVPLYRCETRAHAALIHTADLVYKLLDIICNLDMGYD